jgi:hypothetical protein
MTGEQSGRTGQMSKTVVNAASSCCLDYFRERFLQLVIRLLIRRDLREFREKNRNFLYLSMDAAKVGRYDANKISSSIAHRPLFAKRTIGNDPGSNQTPTCNRVCKLRKNFGRFVCTIGRSNIQIVNGEE